MPSEASSRDFFCCRPPRADPLPRSTAADVSRASVRLGRKKKKNKKDFSRREKFLDDTWQLLKAAIYNLIYVHSGLIVGDFK